MSEYTPTTEEVRERFIDGFPIDTWAVSREECGQDFDRWKAEVERAAAARAWDALAEAAYPLYEAAEAVLLHGADRENLLEPLGRLGAQSNPYRAAEIRERKSA